MSQVRMSDRYVSRLRRTNGYAENEAIDLDAFAMGDLGVWDAVEKCWVKRNVVGEWVPERSPSDG